MRDITESLQAVCDKVTGKPSDINLGMHVPANPEQDLDLIAMSAKTEIERLRAEVEASDIFIQSLRAALSWAIMSRALGSPIIPDEHKEAVRSAHEAAGYLPSGSDENQ